MNTGEITSATPTAHNPSPTLNAQNITDMSSPVFGVHAPVAATHTIESNVKYTRIIATCTRTRPRRSSIPRTPLSTSSVNPSPSYATPLPSSAASTSPPVATANQTAYRVSSGCNSIATSTSTGAAYMTSCLGSRRRYVAKRAEIAPGTLSGTRANMPMPRCTCAVVDRPPTVRSLCKHHRHAR